MKNVTISLDEETAHWAKVWATEHDTSVSKLVGDLLQERMQEDAEYRGIMERFLTREPRKMRSRRAGADGNPGREPLRPRPGKRLGR
ncbi:DUF6364 family protein [Thiohalorhabdus methylotrophus]|uniref:DUF6364 family protein n=1 Tax=Thiohalorhabdus methylotrophus TaxID=3242694 RepID=A0ABV4TSZ0_9GAMM